VLSLFLLALEGTIPDLFPVLWGEHLHSRGEPQERVVRIWRKAWD
jgi:hypothetical protein